MIKDLNVPMKKLSLSFLKYCHLNFNSGPNLLEGGYLFINFDLQLLASGAEIEWYM
jgi:hypothetical protein